jgi:hypothetical protein
MCCCSGMRLKCFKRVVYLFSQMCSDCIHADSSWQLGSFNVVDKKSSGKRAEGKVNAAAPLHYFLFGPRLYGLDASVNDTCSTRIAKMQSGISGKSSHRTISKRGCILTPSSLTRPPRCLQQPRLLALPTRPLRNHRIRVSQTLHNHTHKQRRLHLRPRATPITSLTHPSNLHPAQNTPVRTQWLCRNQLRAQRCSCTAENALCFHTLDTGARAGHRAVQTDYLRNGEV